jgi:hypothetical protein
MRATVHAANTTIKSKWTNMVLLLDPRAFVSFLPKELCEDHHGRESALDE